MADTPKRRGCPKEISPEVLSPPKRQRTEAPVECRFRKTDFIDILVGSETLCLPKAALECIPKLREDAKLGCGPLKVNLGRCSLEVFERLLSFAMSKYLGQTDEEALRSQGCFSSEAALEPKLDFSSQERKEFNGTLDLLVLGLQCGMGDAFQEKLLSILKASLPFCAKDFKKVLAVSKLLPACRELQERPLQVLAAAGRHWEHSWTELFRIFLDCWRLGMKDLVLNASRSKTTCLKAPSVLLAFAKAHGNALGQQELGSLARHIGELFIADRLALKLLEDEDKADFFQILEGEGLRRQLLDVQYGEGGPYIKLPPLIVFKALLPAEVDMFCQRLVRWLEQNPDETHVVTSELLVFLQPQLREDLLLAVRAAVDKASWNGKMAEGMLECLSSDERKTLMHSMAVHLYSFVKSTGGKLNESHSDKLRLLLTHGSEFPEGDMRRILESIDKADLLPEKSKRKGVSRGILVNLVNSNDCFCVSDCLAALVEIAMPHLDHGIRKDEYSFLWAGLQEAPSLARPILVKLLQPRVPLTKAVEEALRRDLSSLAM
mmetsp:Transcript_95570/g.169707  ORF Transcript_95570/g.169707 Transcript_95570/m.169707 type:complete len:548 (+) Transcript_95570:34-1677(+)